MKQDGRDRTDNDSMAVYAAKKLIGKKGWKDFLIKLVNCLYNYINKLISIPEMS